MSLVSCKIKLKLNWTDHYVLSAAGADNIDANSNNITFTIKDTKLYVLAVTFSAKVSQKLSKFLSKGFERSVYWNEYKIKIQNKNTTTQYRYFLKSNFVGANKLFVFVYSNVNNNGKRYKGQRYYLPKCIIKNYNVIIKGKNVYDQPIDSGIKRCEEIRKLTIGQGEDYITGCLLDYDYITNHYGVIAVDLSWQKNRCRSKSNSAKRICWAIKKLQNNGNATDAGNDQSMFLLTIL